MSPKITNYRSIHREISWGLQKMFSLGLLTHTHTCTGGLSWSWVLFIFKLCDLSVTRVKTKHSQLGLKIPQILKKPPFV